MITPSVLTVFSYLLTGIGLPATSAGLAESSAQSSPVESIQYRSPLVVAQTSPRAPRRLSQPSLPSQRNDQSSRGTRASGRSYRGIIRIAIFAVIVLFGLGGWIVRKAAGNS